MGGSQVVFNNFVKNPKGGRSSIEYAITVTMAKELAMVENDETKALIAEIDAQNYDATILASKNIAVKIIGFNWSKKYRCGGFL